MTERTDERRDLYWKQLERASNDTKAWPSFVKEAFPKPAEIKADIRPSATKKKS